MAEVYLSSASGKAWGGHINVVVNNDAIRGTVTVSAWLYYYKTQSQASYGYFTPRIIIKKDGAVVRNASSGKTPNMALTNNQSAFGMEVTNVSFSYTDRCTVTVEGSVECDVTSGSSLKGDSLYGSGSWPCEAQRPASPVKPNTNTIQMGKNLILSISSGGSAYSHTLEYKFGSTTGTIASNVGQSYSWKVPDLAAYCNNATSGVCTITCKTYYSGTYTGSSTCQVTLTVPDATTPTLPDGTLGSQMTITLPRNSGNFRHELKCEFYQSSTTIATGAASSQNWTPGYDLAKQIPNLTYGTATLVCITKNGSAVVGTTKRTFRLTVPENDTTRPSIQSVALSVISSLEGDLAGLYIRGRTGLKAQITASSPYSTIAAYQVSAGDVSAKGNPATITYLVNDGQVTVEAKVTDARGFSRTHSQKIQVLSYSRPKIVPYTGYAEVICERALEDGQLNSSGTYLAIKAGKSFSSFQVDEKERNSCSLRYRFKVSSAPEYGAWVVLLDSTSAEKEIQVLVRDVVPSTSRSYDIEISAIDALGGEHILRFAIMTSAISFVLYDGVDGAGFGKYPEEPHVVDIAAHMTLKVRGKLEVLGAKWQNLGLNAGVAESPFAYGRQEDTGCYYQLSNGNHIHVACNCSFNYRGTPVAINAAQLPVEHRPARPVCSLCAANDAQVVLVCVKPDGYIWAEWVKALDQASGTAVVLWMDGYLDYWI